MKKLILSLMLVAGIVNAASITNTVDHIVNVRGADAPIISSSFITASNMFLYGTGTSPSNVVAYSQFSGATNAIMSAFVPTNRIIQTFAPLTGGGALDVNRTFGFDGSFNYNGAGITNYPAAQMTGTLAYPRLPIGTATNITGDASITVTPSSGTYSLGIVLTNALTTTSLDPVVNGQVLTNGIKQSTIYWGTFLAPAVGETCETEFWVMSAGSTNKYAAGYFSVPALGLLYTGKAPGSASVPPNASFMWTNIQTSGTHFVTNSFKVF